MGVNVHKYNTSYITYIAIHKFKLFFADSNGSNT